MGNLWQRDCQI